MTFHQRVTEYLARARVWTGVKRIQARLARRLLLHRVVNVFEIEGKWHNKLTAKMVFAGHADGLDDLRHAFFPGPASTRMVGRMSVFNARRTLAGTRDASVDVVATDAWPWETSVEGKHHVVQTWLDAHADPTADWELFQHKVLGDNMRRTLQKAQRSPVTLRLSRDAADHERFYRTMLIPMANERFGAEKFVPRLETYLARRVTADAAVLWAELDGVAIAGAAVIFLPALHELALHHYGALPPVLADKARRAEVIALLTGWIFRAASREGMRVNMALTRPFLDDGVLHYKRHWGSSLQPVLTTPRYRMTFVSPRGEDLIAVAPFFHLAREGIRGCAAVNADGGPDAVNALMVRLRSAVFPNLKGMDVRVRGTPDQVALLAHNHPMVRECPLAFSIRPRGPSFGTPPATGLSPGAPAVSPAVPPALQADPGP